VIGKASASARYAGTAVRNPPSPVARSTSRTGGRAVPLATGGAVSPCGRARASVRPEEDSAAASETEHIEDVMDLSRWRSDPERTVRATPNHRGEQGSKKRSSCGNRQRGSQKAQ
jgi:hypothetical protein